MDMTASANYSSVVHVLAERDPDERWTLTSPDLPGFLLRGIDKSRLLAAAPEAIRMLFLLNYKTEVQVFPALPAEQTRERKTRIEPQAFTAVWA